MIYEVNEISSLKTVPLPISESEEVSILVTLINSPFPYLTLFIKGNSAYVHYFPSSGHAGFQSISDSRNNEIVLINSEEEIYIPKYCIVSAEKAVATGMEFLANNSLIPRTINWFEL